MKKALLIFSFCFFLFQLNGQVYFQDDSGQNRFGFIDPDNCEFGGLDGKVGRRTLMEEGRFTDIALHPDGRLFGTTGSIPDYFLVEIDIISRTIKDTLCEVPGPGATSLVYSPSEGVFYTGFGNMYSYHLKNNEIKYLGNVPGGELPGDLFFFKGKLYGVSMPGQGRFDEENPAVFYRYNPEDLEQSEPIFELSWPILFIGLAPKWDKECEKLRIIGTHAVNNENSNHTNTLYEVDLDNKEIIPLCKKIDFGTRSGERIWGLTSSDEFRTNCRLQLDLDVDNSGGRLIDHYLLDSLCTTIFPIADEDVNILSMDGPIDSVVVELVDGALHPGQEILEVEDLELFDISGRGTSRLSLHNRGQADLEDVEAAVRRIRFHIAAEQPLSGERKLFTRLYVNGEASDPAKSFIRANYDERPSAGENAYVELCEYKARNLFQELGGEPRPTGRWEPAFFNQRMPNFFNSWNDPPGIYRYIVQEGGCVADTAEVEVVVFPDPNIGLTDNPRDLPTIDICRGDSIVWDPTFEGGHSYFWTHDRSEEIIRVFKEEGFYQVDARDTNNCIWNGAAYINVLEEESVRTEETVLHCLAEPYQWQGQAVTRDTTICEVYSRANGCDSTHCVTIDIQPPLVRNNSITSCNNRPITYNNVVYEQDTILCDTLLSAAGCESLRCVELIFYDRSESRRVEEVCRGESVRIGGKLYSESGLYGDTIQLANGCDSFALTELIVHPTYETHLDSTIKPGQEVAIGDQRFAFPGRWQVLLESRAGCDSLIVLKLEIDSTSSVVDIANSEDYWSPGLLSRSSDHRFMIYTRQGNNDGRRIRRLELYNAWGQGVFVGHNLTLGATSEGWPVDRGGSGMYFFRAFLEERENTSLVLGGRFIVE